MSTGKLGVGFGLGLLFPLGVITALAYQAPKLPHAPQPPPRIVPLPPDEPLPSLDELPPQATAVPGLRSLDELGRLLEEIESNRAKLEELKAEGARLKALLEDQARKPEVPPGSPAATPAAPTTIIIPPIIIGQPAHVSGLPQEPRRYSLDELGRIIEELETHRVRLKELVEELEPRHEPAPPEPTPEERAEAARYEEQKARLEEFFNALKPDDIRPGAPFEVPDPPPHEGAMIDVPYVVEPPDLIVVEVLEALPGRPITGERLVRPDGTITLDFYGKLYVRGLTPQQIKEKIVLHMRKYLTDGALGLTEHDLETGELVPISVADSDRVFVDVTAYNSKMYYVQGYVTSPGRLPCTGHDTVLDALNYAGGLDSHADVKDIKLIRPASGSRPTRTYKIDYQAIVDQGDPRANLQILPGDRLVVGEHPTHNMTTTIDRIIAPLNRVNQFILTSAYSIRSLSDALSDPKLTAQQRRAIVDAWVDLLWAQVEKGERHHVDKDAFRNLLRRGLAPDAEGGP